MRIATVGTVVFMLVLGVRPASAEKAGSGAGQIQGWNGDAQLHAKGALQLAGRADSRARNTDMVSG